MAFAPIDGQIGEHDVEVLGLPFGCAGLVVPSVFAAIRVHSDDTAGKQLRTAAHLLAVRTAATKRLRGAEQQESGLGIVGDRVPHRTAALPPPLLAGPGFRRHFDGLVLESERRIAWYRPESPQLLAAIGIEGRDRTAHLFIGTAVADEYPAVGGGR